MECSKCGCTKISISFDSRGLAEARCADCGSFIKKIRAQELAEYYEDKIAKLKGEKSTNEATKRRPCRYCTENYVIAQGSMRSYRQYIPIEAKYCPVCGRKLEATDRAY